MIKALFFDLDGTLLNTKKQITPNTRSVLEKCKDKGIKLYIATARPPLLDKMQPSLDSNTLSLFGGGSYYNGGCVIVGDNKYYISISDDIVRKTIHHVFQYDALNIALQLENEKHAFRFPLEEKGYRSWGVHANEALSINQAENMQTVKILIFHSNLIDSTTPINMSLVDLLKNQCLGTAQFYLTDKGTSIQIMAHSVNKWSSIEKICTVMGYGINEIAVFGDDANDVEMLRECGIGVAVANATDEVKAVANYVCDTNDNDGVAKWLEERILN
jgi:Cof subfamily protein (haloacid dehalogenase superfamily)